MKKRVIALLLSLVLVFSVYPAMGLSVNSAGSDDSIELPGVSLGGMQSGTTGACTWTLAGTQLTITGTGAMANYTESSTLPWGTSVTRIVVRNGVTNVGDYALKGCKSLTAISLSASVSQVSATAFVGCSSLKNIVVESTNATYTSVQNSLVRKQDRCLILASCEGVIPQDGSVTSIAAGAFSNYEDLPAVTIGKAVTHIEEAAFEGCSSLTDVWYTGTEAEFEAMTIGDRNDSLLSADWHFNICADDAHLYEADCDSSCENCEFVRNPLTAHHYDNACDPACNECEEIRAIMHIYDNACDGECNTVGCGFTRVPADHVYDDDLDESCNVCGQIRSVQTVIPGDLNDDGLINAMDRVILIRYLVGWEGYEANTFNYAAADLNRDGIVSAMDRVILIRHLVAWEGYETLPKLD